MAISCAHCIACNCEFDGATKALSVIGVAQFFLRFNRRRTLVIAVLDPATRAEQTAFQIKQISDEEYVTSWQNAGWAVLPITHACWQINKLVLPTASATFI